MHFPLSDWIDAHADCRFNLGKSGMAGVVELPRPTPTEIARQDGDRWTEDLHAALAEYLHVDPGRLFLTHGATEANSWVLMFMARRTRSAARRCRIRLPEYPPLVELASHAGFRPVQTGGPVSVAVVALPRNPEGVGWSAEEFSEWTRGASSVLVDETFREFSGRPSRCEDGTPGLWTTGTFTKFFGADDARVGYAIAPPEAAGEFRRFYAVAADDIAPYSAALALAVLARRDRIARQVLRIFARNRAALRAALPSVPAIEGPVYFDRPPGGDGDGLARRCLESSVLVCPGSYFGDPTGVRVCLTRPTFPRDLQVYLRVREQTREHRAARTSGAAARATVRPPPAGTGRARAGPS